MSFKPPVAIDFAGGSSLDLDTQWRKFKMSLEVYFEASELVKASDKRKIILCASQVSRAKPNIVIFLADDQDSALGGMTPMRHTQQWIGAQGVEFVNAFATTPVCCPSRSSILAGVYQSTHRVYNNSIRGGCNSREWQQTYEKQTIGVTLQNSGYRTFYAGKYLNQYGTRRKDSNRVPPGWDWWVGLVGNSVYYNYSLIVNGTVEEHGDDPRDYLTDVLTKWGLEFLRQQKKAEPFLMVLAPPAPHEPFTPAVKYDGKFKGLKAPRTPNFNSHNQDKHWLVRSGPETLPDNVLNNVDEAFRRRWETLLSVDDMVDSVAGRLHEMGLINDTYLIYLSDHGFHLGQFAQAWDKRQPYEADIRIPLLIRGPGLAANTSVLHPALTIDIAPTLYEIAQVQNPPHSDGRSILKRIAKKRKEFGRIFNIEYYGEGGNGSPCYSDNNVKLCSQDTACKCFDARNNTYNCVRHLSNRRNSLACRFFDEEKFYEFYDMMADPYQIKNLAFGKRRGCYRQTVLG